jgi:hypothetical protein
MDRKVGGGQIPASSISFANTFGVLLTVVFYDLVVVPLTNKMGRPITMTMRIGIGFVVQMIALTSGEGQAGRGEAGGLQGYQEGGRGSVLERVGGAGDCANVSEGTGGPLGVRAGVRWGRLPLWAHVCLVNAPPPPFQAGTKPLPAWLVLSS